MDVNIYPWQQSIWHSWQQLLIAERWHHALLFCAHKGSGAAQLGAMLAKTLLCTKNKNEPCNTCHSCQLFHAKTHPDFHHLKPETPTKQLGVDVVRNAAKSAWQTSQLGGVRVILIENAQQMGEAAANALLKTLEEPPSNCYFILLATGTQNMLPTIVSRCNKWQANPPSEQQLKQWLDSTLGYGVSTQVVRLFKASPLGAKDYLEQDLGSVHHQLVELFVDYVKSGKGLIPLTELIAKNQGSAFDWLSFLLLDALKLQLQVSVEIIHCDLSAQAQLLAANPKELLFTQLQALNKLKARLIKHSGLNVELLTTQWLTHFHYTETSLC